MKKYIKSPINYAGSKYRLLKHIIPLFPTNINTFVDLFCGAGNVGVNVNATNIICNDYINYLIELYNKWKNTDIEIINNYIDKTITNFNLSSTNENNFKKFREHYNQTQNIEDLFILVCFSFNYQMRFNNSHKYNSSFGKTASTMNDNIRKNLNIFVNAIKTKDINFINQDFREFDISCLSNKDLIYCDPPYSLSQAVYQDGKRGFKGWNYNDDKDLFNFLDKVNSHHIKFALSNVFESKGNINNSLIEWSKKYNIHYFNMQYNGANYQRTTKGKDVEVLITNY